MSAAVEEKHALSEPKCTKRKDESEYGIAENVKRIRWDEPSTSSACSDIQFQENEVKQSRDGKGPSSLSGDILNLSDDVLLMILAHLSPQDLKRFSETCQRFDEVTHDRTLWTAPDFRSERMAFCNLWEYLNFLQTSTKFIAMRGFRKSLSSKFKMCCIIRKLMERLKQNCSALETFIMEEFLFIANQLPLTMFPSTLTHLEMKGCQIRRMSGHQSYFHGIHEHLPHLEVLVIENCLWLTSHSLMPISKCPKLRVLKLTGCLNVGSCVAYTSVAARFGFKSLEVLDVRKTQWCDSEVGCFNQVPTLTHLYLECPQHKSTLEHHLCITKDNDGSDEDSMGECRHHQEPTDSTSETTSGSDLSSSIINIEFPWPSQLIPEYIASTNFVREPGLLISDVGISSLGPLEMAGADNIRIVRLVAYDVPVACNTKLKHLVVRDFKGVGDVSLAYLVRVTSLRFLDVRGTSVSRDGLELFKSERPDVNVLSDHDDVVS